MTFDLLTVNYSSASSMTTPTNSQKSYTAELKLRAMDYAKEHGNQAAGLHFQIDESIIHRWVKAADAYYYTP